MTELNAGGAAEPMSDERLAEIRAREQATIPGPWFVVDDQSGTLERWINSEDGTLEVGLGYLGNRTEDEAAFIAHARQDIPDLLNEVERIRAAEKRVREVAAYFRDREADLRRRCDKATDDAKATALLSSAALTGDAAHRIERALDGTEAGR